jgi:signal transduction histidine kinase
LDSALTEEELIERVIDVAGNLLRFQAFSAFLYDLRRAAFVLKGSVGELSGKIGEISYQMGEGLTGWVCEHRQPVLLARPHKDPRWRGRHLEFPSDQIASFLAVPVVSRGKTIGVLRAIRRTTDNPLLDNTFTETDMKVLMAIAEQLATGLENIRNLESLIRSERMIAWGELSAKSSHMIGNRVFALKGDVNELKHLLSKEPLDREALTEIQDSLSANILRIEEILQDFRDFLTATQLTLSPGDVNKIILETVREVLPKNASNIDLHLADNLPVALIDEKKFRRAISELLENALGYTTDGSLRIETGIEPANQDKRRSKAMIRIAVEDTGPGVPLDKKSQIFQPFYSSRVKGMGLGLSIVKGIVDSHGGTVFEEGNPGKGARFVILLPLPNRPKKET